MIGELSTYWDDKVLCAPGSVHSLVIGDRAVLFDEKSQRLYEQNPASADLWEAIVRERTLEAASATLAQFGEDPQDVLNLARPAVLQWLRSGFLQPVSRPASADGESMFLEWQACRLAIQFPDGFDHSDFTEIFRNFLSQDDAGAAEVIQLHTVGDLVFFDDGRGGYYARQLDEWVPEVKALFTTRILESSREGFLIHAALVSRQGSGLLICGPSGEGKSTLSVALAHYGFDYHADDVVHFTTEGHAVGAPFAPALKEGSWPHLKQMAKAASKDQTFLRTDGQKVRYVNLTTAQSPLQIDAVLVLGRQAAGPAQIVDIDRLEVLTAILQSAYSAQGSLTASTLCVLVQSLNQAKAGRLVYSDWTDAVATISDFAS